jgi:hypothetical protein
LLGGWLSDFTGSLGAGLWLGPALLMLGAASSLRQRPYQGSRPPLPCHGSTTL